MLSSVSLPMGQALILQTYTDGPSLNQQYVNEAMNHIIDECILTKL